MGLRIVLNAFRHHGVYRRSAASLHTAIIAGAQRLSASRSISGARTLPRHAVDPGAQRLSASRSISAPSAPPPRPPPSSAQRLSASRSISAVVVAAAHLDREQCSTPFGITEYIGCHSESVALSAAISAQRLSASRSISVGKRAGIDEDKLRECSTPFGITEYIGRQVALQGGHLLMCSTPFGITEYIGVGSRDEGAVRGRVLNAFRHHGVYRERGRDGRPADREVLNAFRHHGVYRPPPALRPQPLVFVLNAFRHHGVYRGRNRTSRLRRRSVLNAFRHHGVYRRSCAKSAPAFLRCAQRLSASRSISGGARAHQAARSLCSTPFGITEYIGRWPLPETAGRVRGAQRLSASRSISDRQRTAHVPVAVQCSTPFGITEYIGGYVRLDDRALAQ